MKKNLLIAVIFTLFAQNAFAHKVNVCAWGEGDTIKGYAYFKKSERAQNVDAILYGPDEKKLQQTKTDNEGNFSFTVKYRADYKIFIDIGDGHSTSCKIYSSDFDSTLPPYPKNGEKEPTNHSENPTTVQLQAASMANSNNIGINANNNVTPIQVERMLKKIRTDIKTEFEEFRKEERTQDIINGICIIVGLFGMTLWFKTGQRKNKAAETK